MLTQPKIYFFKVYKQKKKLSRLLQLKEQKELLNKTVV